MIFSVSMYGKSFEGMFEGSMVGSGVNVFAVWGFIITKCRRGFIEINPKLLAFTLGGTEEEISSALEFLQRPDPASRSPAEEGRRLVKEGQFLYRIVNWDKYDKLRNAIDRREYLRIKQQEHRDRKKISEKPQGMVNTATTETGTTPPADPPPEEPSTGSDVKGEKYHPNARATLHILNEASGKGFREVDSNLTIISARLVEKDVSPAGVKEMILRQCKKWKGTEYEDYLQPSTLFGKSKFDGYYANREQAVIKPGQKKPSENCL